MTPFGKYADLVTSLITAFLVVAAVTLHAFSGPTGDYTFIDAAGLLAVGALFGKQAAANGYAKQAQAANTRLDKINAPPADDGLPE